MNKETAQAEVDRLKNAIETAKEERDRGEVLAGSGIGNASSPSSYEEILSKLEQRFTEAVQRLRAFD